MALKPLSPQAARDYIARGAVLVDIRPVDEHARERIAAAISLPAERAETLNTQVGDAPAVIFHCRSGMRTQANAARLQAHTSCEAYVLEGGLEAWKKAGLPVHTDAAQPLELQRQVQLVAGSVIVLGSVLGATVAPGFYALPAVVGAGLIFAGASGFCGLARVLLKMPWNRRMRTS